MVCEKSNTGFLPTLSDRRPKGNIKTVPIMLHKVLIRVTSKTLAPRSSA